MEIPQKPPNEIDRLNILQHLNVLDTATEERFDRITRIAQRLFNVPIALVSLIDTNRQWFKSCIGLDVKETSREISFCGHTILKNEILIIEDATKDKRFCDNPLVIKDPKIRFYIGCPLTIKGSYNIGTLCLIDRKPRKFSSDEIEVIKDLAGMIQSELDSLSMSATDELTTLFNRRGFFLVANNILSLFKRNRRSLTLVYFDLDEFKLVNDTHGHEAGDKILKIFSQFLVSVFRKSDIISRIGGDEFCVLITESKDINASLKRLHNIVSNYNKNGIKIHYSTGYVKYDRKKHLSIEALIADADHDMYKHKSLK